LPVLLDLPIPRLRAYPRETVIAEKFQAMVVLEHDNSRMKDFYEIWMLSRSYEFDPDRLSQAIGATFARRKTAIPTELPDAFTPAFAEDVSKQRQWKTFLDSIEVPAIPLDQIISAIRDFVMPHVAAARGRTTR
jgi:hypothetical protein